MATALSASFCGSAACAIQMGDMDTRIYYQGYDGAIYELVGKGAATSGSKYSTSIRVPANRVRSNTPLAVVSWGPGFAHIRLYYADPENYLHELCWDGNSWTAGSFDGKRYRIVTNSGFLYAICTEAGGDPRVGFQSDEKPELISEAFYNGGWNCSILSA